MFGSEEYQAMADSEVSTCQLWDHYSGCLHARARPHVFICLGPICVQSGPRSLQSHATSVAYCIIRARILTFAIQNRHSPYVRMRHGSRFSVTGWWCIELPCDLVEPPPALFALKCGDAEYFAASTASREGMYVRPA